MAYSLLGIPAKARVQSRAQLGIESRLWRDWIPTAAGMTMRDASRRTALLATGRKIERSPLRLSDVVA